MPHLVILYTPNLETELDMTGLCRSMADAMLTVRDEAGAQVFPTGGTRVLRGGCWFNVAQLVRCSVRFDTVPGDVDVIGAGVRPARTP